MTDNMTQTTAKLHTLSEQLVELHGARLLARAVYRDERATEPMRLAAGRLLLDIADRRRVLRRQLHDEMAAAAELVRA